MKRFLLLLTLLSLTPCFAEDTAPQTYSVAVSYVIPDGKKISSSTSNLVDFSVQLPIHISQSKTLLFDISGSASVKDGPLDEVNINFSDSSNIVHSSTGDYTLPIFHGYFPLQNGKEITVLKTTTYSITLTVTAPNPARK